MQAANLFRDEGVLQYPAPHAPKGEYWSFQRKRDSLTLQYCRIFRMSPCGPESQIGRGAYKLWAKPLLHSLHFRLFLVDTRVIKYSTTLLNTRFIENNG